MALSLLLVLPAGCDADADRVAPAAHRTDDPGAQPAAPAQSTEAAPAAATPGLSPGEDAKLRRKYGPADMKYNACVKVLGTTIEGRNCPATSSSTVRMPTFPRTRRSS